MNNNNKLSQDQVNKLLKMASKRIGSNPSQLKQQLENGSIEKVIRNLNPQEANKLKSALSNPIIAKKLLGSQEAQNIIRNLSKEK